MKFDPRIHHRRSLRMMGHDYAGEGGYFITIVVQKRECLFGEIVDGEMNLNAAGEMAVVWWEKLPEKFSSASLDAFVLMPNHFHGVIVLESKTHLGNTGQTHGSDPTDAHRNVGADPRVGPNAQISQIVQWYKTMTTNQYIRGVKEFGWTPFMGKLWQRNYYEHIIRNSDDHERNINYIHANPSRWTEDVENPGAQAPTAKWKSRPNYLFMIMMMLMIMGMMMIVRMAVRTGQRIGPSAAGLAVMTAAVFSQHDPPPQIAS